MTAHRDPWIGCDGASFDPHPLEDQYPADAGEDAFVDGTIRAVRAAAKAEGWTFTRDGRDLCPACSAVR